MSFKVSKYMLICGLIITLNSGLIFGQIMLPSLFSDNMVLQQNSMNKFWGWSDPGSNISIIPSWTASEIKATTDEAGRWEILLPTPGAGGPFSLEVKDEKGSITINNILIGEVWLCAGQSNMEMPMKGYLGEPVLNSNMEILRSGNDNIRFISVPRNSRAEPQQDFDGFWKAASPGTVGDFSATAYYFAKMLEEILQVPVGLIEVSYGGSCIQTWMSKNSAVPFEDKMIPETDEDIKEPNRTPTGLFNGMLNPVIGYGIQGAIWYQGETNYHEPELYEKLFPEMVKEWRSLWDIREFSFYYTQIAPYDNGVNKSKDGDKTYNSAFLRDAQRKAITHIPNSGMAVLLDAGERDCIHPADKQSAGERLALWALGDTYDMDGIGFRSPSYRAVEITDGSIIVSFDDIGNGLTSYGRDLLNFEIAGSDRVFYPARATLRRKSVILSADSVKDPVAVRYAFKDFAIGDLFGTNGLPVSSFRTDDW